GARLPGGRDAAAEPLALTAAREVAEETGIDCGEGSPLAGALREWQLENVYEIYPRWRARYAPGVTHNTEHLFGLCLPARVTPRLDPHEHTDWRWLTYCEAAGDRFSPSHRR